MRYGSDRSRPQDRDWSGRGAGGRRAPAIRHHGKWRRFRNKSGLSQAGYVLASLGAVLVLAVGAGGYSIYWRYVHNIHVVNVGGLTNAPNYGPLNILVLGSQQRQGQIGYGHGWFGMASGGSAWTSNSDNLIVVHLDSHRTHAIVLSIPRDTMVYEPACHARIPQVGTGTMGPYSSAIIDGALNIGGPTCAVKTVEALTGLKLNYFVEFDFNSFREMVNALGGVRVCVPPGGYHDPAARINLKPGLHKLVYNMALAYVRQRHNLGGPDAGGDLPRILVQQAFISSVIQQVNQSGLLANTPQLLRIASVATKALTVDQNLGNPSTMLGLAKSLVHLHANDVTLLTMPTIYDPANQNRLLPDWIKADVIFQLIQENRDWPGHHLPMMPANQVKVQVLNGSGVSGLAGRTARELRKLGFDVVGKPGDATATSTTTVSYSGTAQADEAWTLMNSLHSLPAAQNLLAEPTPQTGHNGVITLTLGSDYANFAVNRPPAHMAVVSKKSGKSKKSSSAGTTAAGSGGPAIQTRNAGASICSGLPHQSLRRRGQSAAG